MKRKLFDPRLYRSGLAQLRLAGTLFCILAILGAGVPSLLTALQIRQAEAAGAAAFYPELKNLTILLLGVMYLAPVALCLTLFGFLNHRSGSDFYHSIPQTRTCLFASFGSAVLTWVSAAILLGMGASAAVFGAFGIAGNINMAPLPYVLFTDLAGAVLLTAEMLLSMSITGTVVTNLTVFGLLLFLPRFLTTVFADLLVNRLQFITTDAFGFWGNALYNIPVSIFITAFTGRTDRLYTAAGPIWYSILLAAVYFVLAGVFFTRRKSESAGRSAPNRPMQHIYRCLIALPPSLVIPYLAVSWNSANGDFFTQNRNMIVVMAVVTLLVYYLFELISTKTARNLLRVTPVFLAVIAFDVIFGFAAKGGEAWFLHDTPAAADIRSVAFQYLDNDSSGATQSYNRLMVRKVSLTDGQLIGQVSQALTDTVRRVEDSGSESDNFEYFVRLKLKSGRVLERRLYATAAEIEMIEKIKTDSAQFHSAQTGLPPEADIRKITMGGLSTENTEKVWDCFRGEYAALTDDQKAQMIGTTSSPLPGSESSQDAEKDTVGTLTVQGSVGLQDFQSNYALSHLTPRTRALYMELANQENGPLFWSRVKRLAEGDKVSYGYSLFVLNVDSKLFGDTNGGKIQTDLAQSYVSRAKSRESGTSASDRTIMNILLRHRGSTAVNTDGSFVQLTIYNFSSENDYSDKQIFFNLTDDEIKQIHSLYLSTQSKQDGSTETA